jgi:hypothetical protein
MIECFNNIWIILISVIILFIIMKKIYKLLFSYENKNNNKKKSFDLLPDILPTLTSYYVGIN